MLFKNFAHSSARQKLWKCMHCCPMVLVAGATWPAIGPGTEVVCSPGCGGCGGKPGEAGPDVGGSCSGSWGETADAGLHVKPCTASDNMVMHSTRWYSANWDALINPTRCVPSSAAMLRIIHIFSRNDFTTLSPRLRSIPSGEPGTVATDWKKASCPSRNFFTAAIARWGLKLAKPNLTR